MKTKYVVPSTNVAEMSLLAASFIDGLADVILAVLRDVEQEPVARAKAIAVTLNLLDYLNYALDELEERHPNDDVWSLRNRRR
jgi:hypothetical protein